MGLDSTRTSRRLETRGFQIENRNLLLSFFEKGYYKLNADNLTQSNLKGKGILVAETVTFGAGCLTGKDNMPAPSDGEIWQAGFFHPMEVTDLTITEGTIYVGRL